MRLSAFEIRSKVASPIRDDQLLREIPMVSLDLETTGLDVSTDRIVQIAILELAPGSLKPTILLDSLVDPGLPIAAKSTGIHGISNADVVGAPGFIDIDNALREAIDNRLVIGHHIGFDLAVLQHESTRAGLSWRQPPALDLALLATALEPELPDHGLESVADWLGVTVSGRHSALGDSRMVAEMLARLMPVLQARQIHTYGEACALASTRTDLIAQQQRAGWHQDAPRQSLSHFERRVAALREIKSAQADQARRELADGKPAVEVQADISRINVDLHHDAVELCIEETIESDLGEPPVPFEAIIIGSGARLESLLYPDQDNGFILHDDVEANFAEFDAWFESLANRMTDTLAEIGFHRCPGWVMATNPRWRKSLAGFKQQTSQWTTSARGEALHYCNIFLDFKAFFGSGALSESLRDSVIEQARTQRFLSRLYDIHKNHTGALGWFGRIITDPNPGPNHGKIDLKTAGTLPIVTAVRLMSLHYDIRGETTRDRIEQLKNLGLLDEADALLAAYAHIVFLLLRQQLEDHAIGAPLGNYLPPSALSKSERAQLVAAYKVIARFCKQVSRIVRQPPG